MAGGLALTALNRRVLASQQPNEQVVLGMIGVGGMGTNRLREFLKLPDVRIGAICDVDQAHIDREGEPDGLPRLRAADPNRRGAGRRLQQ